MKRAFIGLLIGLGIAFIVDLFFLRSLTLLIYIICGLIGWFVGLMLEKNKSKREKMLIDIIRAEDKGDPKAKKKLEAEFDKGLTDEEYNRLRRKAYYSLAFCGVADAQYWMGHISMYVDKNANEALKWYEEAANQGNTAAMLALALGYSEFINNPEYDCYIGFGYDAKKERSWKLKAVECGDPEAQVSLALDYWTEHNIDGALELYQRATKSKDCKVLMRAYSGLAKIYGNILDKKNFNEKLQEEYLIRVLEMKQNNAHDTKAYDETEYASAASTLGFLYLRSYENNGSSLMSKRAAYCFCLSYFSGNDFAKENIKETNYQISEFELSNWQQDAETLSFHLPQ